MTSSKWQKLAYLNRHLVWLAILALAVLAVKKDAELEKTLRRLDGLQQHQNHDHELLEKRMDVIMKTIRERHP